MDNIQDYNSGWVNTQTSEKGYYKNGKPKRYSFLKRLFGRAKTDLYETELVGTTIIEHTFIWQSSGTQHSVGVYRVYNKFTNETKEIYCNACGCCLNFDPVVWDRLTKLVEM